MAIISFVGERAVIRKILEHLVKLSYLRPRKCPPLPVPGRQACLGTNPRLTSHVMIG
jgi:hypothetical protein